jgi:hypothetical protein
MRAESLSTTKPTCAVGRASKREKDSEGMDSDVLELAVGRQPLAGPEVVPLLLLSPRLEGAAVQAMDENQVDKRFLGTMNAGQSVGPSRLPRTPGQ